MSGYDQIRVEVSRVLRQYCILIARGQSGVARYELRQVDLLTIIQASTACRFDGDPDVEGDSIMTAALTGKKQLEVAATISNQSLHEKAKVRASESGRQVLVSTVNPEAGVVPEQLHLQHRIIGMPGRYVELGFG